MRVAVPETRAGQVATQLPDLAAESLSTRRVPPPQQPRATLLRAAAAAAAPKLGPLHPLSLSPATVPYATAMLCMLVWGV